MENNNLYGVEFQRGSSPFSLSDPVFFCFEKITCFVFDSVIVIVLFLWTAIVFKEHCGIRLVSSPFLLFISVFPSVRLKD